ncbi:MULTISPECIES: hypothetical protein [unclassified Novosphingobium]|uniref:hypothetical protein n=2 Tax=Novosphingobium TaxID=165696 RepID=UPI00086B2A89|nr:MULTISPECIES: hypothetical protein [unclassified Novosphingobium]MBN9143767.1 hypothetical protein [Novosphingobium sp.]ODU84375.1 MAG: hypothetical protein ABT10_03050 [Novosphingobium sp. SCN 63-17]OJX92915.1 MAG: hypothetical protein BGP00_23650 [Novosphingobium sp. 63-713]
MMGVTHGDLARDFGRMEATQDAMMTRMDSLDTAMREGFKGVNQRLDATMAAFESGQTAQNNRLDALESTRDQAHGAGKTLMWLLSGGAGTTIVLWMSNLIHFGGK